MDEGDRKSYIISEIGDVSGGSVQITINGRAPSLTNNSRLLVTISTLVDIAKEVNCNRSDFNITGGFFPTLTLISDTLKALQIERNAVINLTSHEEDRNFQFLVVSSIDGDTQRFLIQPLMQSICDVGMMFLPIGTNTFTLQLSEGDGSSLTGLNLDSLAFDRDDQK